MLINVGHPQKNKIYKPKSKKISSILYLVILILNSKISMKISQTWVVICMEFLTVWSDWRQQGLYSGVCLHLIFFSLPLFPAHIFLLLLKSSPQLSAVKKGEKNVEIPHLDFSKKVSQVIFNSQKMIDKEKANNNFLSLSLSLPPFLSLIHENMKLNNFQSISCYIWKIKFWKHLNPLQ